MSFRKVSVITPVYRQADHIERVARDYVAALAKVPLEHELILVVNGSGDRSLEVCRELEAKVPTIRTVVNEPAGWGPAIRRGLNEARGDLLCFTNSARTAPEDLVLMILYAVAYPGVALKANRRIRDNWWRRLGSLLYNLECRVLFDLAVFDVNATPKVFPRSFGRLLELQRDDDLIDVEFNVVCRHENYPMLEVPVFSTRRHGGYSTTHLGSALRMYLGVFEMRRRFGPSPPRVE